jgi:hypothetical protein
MTVGRRRELLLIFGTMAHENNKQTLYGDPYQKKSCLMRASAVSDVCDTCARLLPGPKGSAPRQVLIHALDASAPIHLVRAHPAGQPSAQHNVLRARLMSLSRAAAVAPRTLFRQIRDVGKYLHAARQAVVKRTQVSPDLRPAFNQSQKAMAPNEQYNLVTQCKNCTTPQD